MQAERGGGGEAANWEIQKLKLLVQCAHKREQGQLSGEPGFEAGTSEQILVCLILPEQGEARSPTHSLHGPSAK